MSSEKERLIYPKLVRQTGKTLLNKLKSKRSQTKYRWVWFVKNEGDLIWSVYARSVFWFHSYLECKNSALIQEIPVPAGATVRLYVEIYKDGLVNMVEILNENDDEDYPDSDEEEHRCMIKYRWEWKILYPGKDQWEPYIKSDKLFKSFSACIEDGKDFNFDVVCSAALRLCIQVWCNNECILENYYREDGM